MRRAAKVDANQPAIVKALRAIPGVEVQTGHDDILVGYQGVTRWYEIKNRDGKNKLQDGQKDLERDWPGHYRVVHTLEEILAEILG